VAASEEDLFDRLIEAQRDGIEDLTRRVGTGVSAVIRAMQNELNATITRLELTADATAAVSPGDTARLERTMMAIAEHQESVLDGRLSELRESMASFQQTEETAAEVEDVLALDEKTAPEGPRLGVEEAFPWPEPLPELADESATDEAAPEPAAEDAEDAEATQEEPPAETAAAEKATETVEEPEVGEAGITSEEEPAVEDKPVKKKRRRKKKSPEPAETD
jgi:hypothetical protein